MSWVDTPLQAAIRKKSNEILAEQLEAEKRCRNRYELEQCRDAYAKLMHHYYDVIGQQFGEPPMLRRAVR